MRRKNIFWSIILLIFSWFFITDIEVVQAKEVDVSRWKALQPERKVTSEGLIIDYDFSKIDIGPYWFDGFVTVKVTIPKDYQLDTIVIVPDVFTEIAKYIYKGDKNNLVMNNIIQPGDKIGINFIINNLSNYTYNYDETSFEIFPKEDIVYNKLSDKDIPKGETNCFNEQTVNTNYHFNRTYNTALKALIPGSSNKYMTDEVLDTNLKDKGYINGINDYTKYLLDFYNKKYKANYTRLDQFPDGIIREILGENDPFLQGNDAYKEAGVTYVDKNDTKEDILKQINKKTGKNYQSLEEYILEYYNGKYQSKATRIIDLTDEALDNFFASYGMEQGSPYNIETNTDVIVLSYNYFYNKGLSFGFKDDMYKVDDSEDLAIGEYMRDKAKGDNYIKEKALTLNSNTSDYTLSGTLYTAGPYVNNAYLNYEFNLDMQFTYSALKGTVIAKYIDVEGNILNDDIITTDMVGKDYSTVLKKFDGYTLDSIDGEESGKYIDGEIVVTYIYNKEVPKDSEETIVVSKPDDDLEITPPSTKVGLKNKNMYLTLFLVLAGIYLLVIKVKKNI